MPCDDVAMSAALATKSEGELGRARSWPALAAVGALALGLGLVAEHLAHSWDQPAWIPIADLAVGWLLVGCGLLAVVARPAQPAGGRLVLAGFLWFVGTFMAADAPGARAIGFAFGGYHDVVLVALCLAFPNRRPVGRPARLAVAAVTLAYVAQSVARLVLTAPDTVGIVIVDSETALRAVTMIDVGRGLIVLAAGLVMVALIARPERRPQTSLLLAAGVATSVASVASARYAATVLGLLPELPDDVAVPLTWAFNVVRVTVPLVIFAGILRGEAARAAMAAAIGKVGAEPTSERLRLALATALGDPGLRLLRWDRTLARYRDDDGSALTLEELAAAVRQRGETLAAVDADGSPLAALTFDRGSADEVLIDAAVSLSRLVLVNEHLASQIGDQLDEVRASRARIVEAGDRERRRIERDLHDGVQQRMVALAVELRSAEGDAEGRAAALRRGADEILGILDEVRELAQGIHPPVLTEAGLGAAIRAVADRSPVPVELNLSLTGANGHAAVIGYFVVSEALANIAKHARETATAAWITAVEDGGRLVLVVEDDGPGGADPRGHGLEGLSDRVAAMDGRFTVGPRPGGGTTVRAEIPLP